MAEQKKEEFQEQELERYGVWVKAGPEEVVEADEEDYSFSDLPGDEPLGAVDETPAPSVESSELHLDDDLDALEIPTGEFDDFDSDDLGSLDNLDDFGEIEETSEVSAELGDVEQLEDDLDLGSIEDIGDELGSLDDFDIASDLPDIEETGSIDEVGEPDLPSFGETADLAVEEASLDTDDSLGDIQIADDLGALDDLDDFETTETVVDEALTTELGADDDLVTLDDLDIEEADVDKDPFAALEVGADEESGAEITALEAEAGVEPLMPGSDEEIDEISLDDIQMSDSSGGELPELEADSLDALDTLDTTEHDFTPEDQGIEIISAQPTNHISPEEEELLAEEPAQAVRHMDDDEREAFQRIQSELDDIKRELHELKEALRSGAAVQLAEPAPEARIEDDATHHGPGFFEEDEDETIALTGDELDNILNTAEFTEETGEAEELEEDFVAAVPPSAETSDAADLDLETEITEIALEDSDEAVIDELADMNIEAELADIEALDDSSEEPTADELELDLDEIESLSGEELAEAPEMTVDEATDLELSIDETELELDDSELETGTDEGFEEFAAAVQDDLSAAGEDLEVEEIDLDQQLDISAADLTEEEEDSEGTIAELPAHIKSEIRSVLSYMDQLLEALPDDKIEEFAQSEHFDVYKRLFEELGLET